MSEMAGKVPYYYSDLTGKEKLAAAGLLVDVEEPPIPEPEPIYSEDPEAGLPGFYNPLLSIEPDISTGDTNERRKMSVSQKKKKKKKKKSNYASFYKQSNVPSENGCNKSPSRSARLPLPSERLYGFRDQRRNSEPNLYEEIPESFKEETYSGSLAGFVQQQQRRKSSGPHYSSSSRLPEVLDEVQEVQQKHALILENLNLDFETMLMPESSASSNHSPNKHLNKLSLKKSLTRSKADSHDTLPSQGGSTPLYVSGNKIYSESTSGGSHSNEYTLNQAEPWNLNASSSSGENVYYHHHHRFQRGLSDPSGSVGSLRSLRHMGEPLYMLYDDAHKQERLGLRDPNQPDKNSVLIPEQDDNIYEEVDHSLLASQNQNPPVLQGGEEANDRLSWNSSHFFENNLAQSGSELEDDDISTGMAAGFAARIIGKGKKRHKKKENEGITSGFTRWFSTRRKEYELEKINKLNIKPPIEDTYSDGKLSKKHRPPLTLPPPLPGLNQEQVKRRLIVQSIVDSENNYVNSLQRLIRDYKRSLEEGNPPVISSAKLSVMFYGVEQILQCHNIFGIALTQCVREWDFSEKIGDVFIASFSKAMVLDIYSDFINNFSVAMETAKQSSKNKSAFADFLKMKQITSPDRLSFFGLMVKPVQRFPQFIMLLQDLLKHTPPGHHDRLSLQLALTQLELLADTLNERKRESEQYHAVRDVMKHLGNKFSLKSVSDGHHFLIRQDNVIQLDMDQNGMVIKSKSRRVYLLNDLLVCVSVSPRSTDGMNSTERFTLKWAVPLGDVEVQEDVAPATRNLMAATGRCKSILGRNLDKNSEGSFSVQALYDDLSDLVHDLELMSRIAALVGSLRKPYQGLTIETLQALSIGIQDSIKKKDDEITLLDSCCLQLSIPVKPRANKEVVCLQMMTPGIKMDWITELRLAKLAMDANNMRSWDVQEQEKRPCSKMPLFVENAKIYESNLQSEVTCGCFYIIHSADDRCLQNVVYLVGTDGVRSSITVRTVRMNQVKNVHNFILEDIHILATEAVPSFFAEIRAPAPSLGTHDGQPGSDHPSGLGETIWVGTNNQRILMVDGQHPDTWLEMGELSVSAPVQHIKYHCRNIFAALTNGTVLIFYRNAVGLWEIDSPQIVTLGTEAVTCLLPIGQALYCACEAKVWVIDAPTREVLRSYTLPQGEDDKANLLAHSGTGLWISLQNSATICLYHTETFHHLQDINVAANVNRLLAGNPTYAHLQESPPVLPEVYVTTLLASRGLLWVGTNVGIVVTIPLPRLEGVPIISGRSNVAYHAHLGPVTMLLSLQQRPLLTMGSFPSCPEEMVNGGEGQEGLLMPDPSTTPTIGNSKFTTKQKSDSLLPSGWLSRKIMGQPHRPNSGPSEVHSSGSKTLPRGMTFCQPANFLTSSTPQHHLPDSDNDVYGLYADLMNVQDYEKDSQEKLNERLNQSDPELVNFHLATLDRRLDGKSGRPRSWDLSNMAVSEDSDSSVVYDASSVAASSVSCPEARAMQNNHTNGKPPVAPCKPVMIMTNTAIAAATAKTHTRAMHKKLLKNLLDPAQKTLLVLTGGSGYANWRWCDREAIDRSGGHAEIIVWEMKL